MSLRSLTDHDILDEVVKRLEKLETKWDRRMRIQLKRHIEQIIRYGKQIIRLCTITITDKEFYDLIKPFKKNVSSAHSLAMNAYEDIRTKVPSDETLFDIIKKLYGLDIAINLWSKEFGNDTETVFNAVCGMYNVFITDKHSRKISDNVISGIKVEQSEELIIVNAELIL